MRRPFAPPGVSLVGLAENLPSVLAYLVRRRARRWLFWLPSEPAARAEAFPIYDTGELRPRRWRLPAYLALTDGEDLLPQTANALPPLYPTSWGLRPLLRLLDHPRLAVSLAGVVHAQNDLIVHGAISPRDRVTVQIHLERLHRDAVRSLLVIRSDVLVAGERRMESRATLVAGLSAAEAEAQARGAGAAAAPSRLDAGDWKTIREVHLGRRHSLRYALLSGDVNPIHLHPLTSRPLGFERPILHGFCLKAILSHALIRWAGAGDPSSLRRLRLRFRRAVTLPARLAVQVQGPRVRVVQAEMGPVYAQGRYRMVTLAPQTAAGASGLTDPLEDPTMPQGRSAPGRDSTWTP